MFFFFKVWEPERICQNSDHELSVNSGIVIHRNTSLPKGVPIKRVENKDVVQHKLDSDIDSEDSISQELRYFKPIQPNPISRFIFCTFHLFHHLLLFYNVIFIFQIQWKIG